MTTFIDSEIDRVWHEFLDVLTGSASALDLVPVDFEPDEPEDENWRDGTMADGFRRARRNQS